MSVRNYANFSYQNDSLIVKYGPNRSDKNINTEKSLERLLTAAQKGSLQFEDQNWDLRRTANLIFNQFEEKYAQRSKLCVWLDRVKLILGMDRYIDKITRLHRQILDCEIPKSLKTSSRSENQTSTPPPLAANKPANSRANMNLDANLAIPPTVDCSLLESVEISSNLKILQKAHICIQTISGGLIGEKSDPSNRIPEYLCDITLEDDTPLILHPNDYFIPFYTFLASEEYQKLQIPSDLVLPSNLFQDKKDGDTLKLKYKGTFIQLHIQQNDHHLRFQKGPFEQVLNACINRVVEDGIPLPMFGKYDEYWYYHLNPRSVYKINQNKQICVKKDDDHLSLLKEPTTAAIRYLGEKQEHFLFCLTAAGFLPEDFDIILNSSHFIVYGKQSLTFDSQIESQIPNELIATLRWNRLDYFKNSTFEQIQEKMSRSLFECNRGILLISIPIH